MSAIYYVWQRWRWQWQWQNTSRSIFGFWIFIQRSSSYFESMETSFYRILSARAAEGETQRSVFFVGDVNNHSMGKWMENEGTMRTNFQLVLKSIFLSFNSSYLEITYAHTTPRTFWELTIVLCYFYTCVTALPNRRERVYRIFSRISKIPKNATYTSPDIQNFGCSLSFCTFEEKFLAIYTMNMYI